MTSNRVQNRVRPVEERFLDEEFAPSDVWRVGPRAFIAPVIERARRLMGEVSRDEMQQNGAPECIWPQTRGSKF